MITPDYHLILGSQSPRRRQLLMGVDVPFDSITIDADEHFPDDLTGADIPLYISRAKARAYARKLQPSDLLITSDTIVWSGGKMLGKPHDEEDAIRMLHLLSGHTHQVFTGVCLAAAPASLLADRLRVLANTPTHLGDTDKLYLAEEELMTCLYFVDKTDVTFRHLSDEEISYYVQQYHPLDKAGSYGVQEYIGYIGVTGMHGSYFNVMGFPIERVYEVLKLL